MKTPLFLLVVLFIGCTTKKKSQDRTDNFYIYDSIEAFNLTYKDTSRNILLLWDAYGSSTRDAYSKWLLSDSVGRSLSENYSVFIFRIEDIHKKRGRPDHLFLEKFYPDTNVFKYPRLVLLNKQRMMKEVPLELYYGADDSTAILRFLSSINN